VSLSSLLGQPTAFQTLTRALESGRVHHAYRFEGPAGVGKQTAALLLAQALVCPEEPGRGCEKCSACRRAVTFAKEAPEVPGHPDVLLVGRGVYPPGLLGGASEATGISVEQIRRIVLPRVGMPPHESRNLVILIRDAEELTVAAANALLKTLEEPHSGVHFVLLTSRPAQLLDTILSRSLAVRFGALPEDVLRTLFVKEGLPEEVLPYAQGSLSRARALSDPSSRETRDAFLRNLDEAIKEGHTEAALRFAEERPDGRHELLELLAHVATTYASRAREGDDLSVWAERHRIVTHTMRHIHANASPALVVETMVGHLVEAGTTG
jgi:DNA polymerase-3 subunit delta'